MRIVIVGAGRLGYSIAELLSNEEYDVVVIDTNEANLSQVRSNLDVLTILADGASPSAMMNPDIRNADILAAVTALDEVNIVSCVLAKKNGITHTIARIRDEKYLAEPESYLKKNFDIDLALSPELICAREIHRLLRTPSALNVEDFADGKVRLFETRIADKSPLAHLPLKNLTLPDHILAAMIFRNNLMIIPHGDDKLLPMDNVYFIGDAKEIDSLSQALSAKSTTLIRHVMVVGGGRTGQTLALLLEETGMTVKIIEKDPRQCRSLSSRLKKSMVLCGDATNIDLLKQEGINDTDAIICTTKDDKLNLMIAALGKHLGARKTIVRVARNEYVSLMEQIGIDVVLSSRLLAASEVLTFIRHSGVVSVSLLEGASVEAVEIIVQKNSPVAGKPLMDAHLPKECLVGAVVHEGQTIIPRGATILHENDRVILILEAQASASVLSYFKGGL